MFCTVSQNYQHPFLSEYAPYHFNPNHILRLTLTLTVAQNLIPIHNPKPIPNENGRAFLKVSQKRIFAFFIA